VVRACEQSGKRSGAGGKRGEQEWSVERMLKKSFERERIGLTPTLHCFTDILSYCIRCLYSIILLALIVSESD